MRSGKAIHILVLDSGPILRNDPSLSTLQAKSDHIYITQAIISEIRDPVARARFETTYLPFITVRDPRPASISFVKDFSRKTGDLTVLSPTDIGVLALAYELECEKNGGDWRLRRSPGQKRLNGSPPTQDSATLPDPTSEPYVPDSGTTFEQQDNEGDLANLIDSIILQATDDSSASDPTAEPESQDPGSIFQGEDSEDDQILVKHENAQIEASDEDTSGSEGWITPSNLKKQQAKDNGSSLVEGSSNITMQIVTLTTDFAMQNVLLQMNLNLVSSSLQQIRHIRTYILRCHACFEKTKDMTKQFCPRCGKPTLTRVSCSTNQKGEFQMHLKKNMQWNSRGDRYSIPKPTSGSANQLKGRGKGGWGQELILAEDQKEYMRAVRGQGRRKERDLMDEDYLPSILTGAKAKMGGMPKIGAGRNVNSRKRQ